MPKQVELTCGLAMAASRDAGNRSMREGRRTKWAVKDWNVACETFARLWPQPEHGQPDRTSGGQLPGRANESE